MGDNTDTVAIFTWTDAGAPLYQRITRGSGYVAAVLGEVLVVEVYFSPNRPLADFEAFLVELGEVVIRSRTRRVLVASDFNAKSRAWGSPVANAFGQPLEQWVVITGLIVMNRGSTPSCVRPQGSSIVDITFASQLLR